MRNTLPCLLLAHMNIITHSFPWLLFGFLSTIGLLLSVDLGNEVSLERQLQNVVFDLVLVKARKGIRWAGQLQLESGLVGGGERRSWNSCSYRDS